MKSKKIVEIILLCLFLGINQASYAREDLSNIDILTDRQNNSAQLRETEGVISGGNNVDDEESYSINLEAGYNYGEQKIALEWTGVTDEVKLADKVKVGDYVNYPIYMDMINQNFNTVSSKIRDKSQMSLNNTLWRVIYNDGRTVKIISTTPVASTEIAWEDYDWSYANPYAYGDAKGDSGGYGLYYQLSEIARCFTDKNYVDSIRPFDLADLPHTQALTELKQYLGRTDAEQLAVQIRQDGFEEIKDTDKHGGIFGIGGKRNYDSVVGTILDRNDLYIGGDKFFIPNYYNAENSLNAVYYIDGTEVKLHRVNPKGKSMTAGIKVVITLKTDLYQVSGDGTKDEPWEMSSNPGNGTYTVYQKNGEGEYEEKITTKRQSAVLTVEDGIRDLAGPDRPSAELSTIRNDGWNLRLDIKAGDNGTSYTHKIVAKASEKEYSSNEASTLVATGVAGFSYIVDESSNTDPGNNIMLKAGEALKIDRTIVNKGKYIHIKAIDYAGNVSEILHMPLNFVFRDLNLFKTYQEASNIDETGIARTPGWNYVNIDWNPIEIEKDDPSELPDVELVLDVSGSMNWNGRIGALKSGAKGLVDNLLNMYPNMRIGVVHYNNCFGSWWDFSAKELVAPTNNRAILKSNIDRLYASGENNAENGINLARQILAKSTQKSKIMIVMTDGGRTSDGERSYEASRQALRQARRAGINIKSLLINEDPFASVIYRADNNTICDDVISVSDNSAEIYKKIAYDMYQKIQDSLTAKYYAYRDQEGVNQYELIKGELTEVKYGDGGATDKAGPTKPLVTLSETADKNGTIKMNVWAEDRGTSYEFYVKFVHPRTKAELLSNPTVQEVKTGIKGYAWTVDENSNTDPGGNIRNLQFSFGEEFVGKWLHIRAVDWAGNWGDVTHIRIETSRFITWEELNETKELFCVQHGQTIPAREDGEHLNAKVTAGSGEYKIDEVVADPKTGDRIGTRFVEGTTTNVYGTQDIYSYSLGKYIISPDTPIKRPGKEGNATEKEAYILNYYKQNNSLESFVQKAMYATEVSKGNVTWNWETTVESEKLVAEASAYAKYKEKGYEISDKQLSSEVYMDDDYKDILIGPFSLQYDPQGFKSGDREVYFASITGMKIYDQDNKVISELDKDGNNIGNIQAEFVYTGTAIASKRLEPMFTKEKYKFPVGDEQFYIKLKYNQNLDNVSKINKIDFIHTEYNVDAQYNVLVGTYNKVKWTPNRITRYDKDVLWCNEVENGHNTCIHNKTYSHIVGCYFYLTATVYSSYREIPSQTLIDVLWAKNNYTTKVQSLTKIVGGNSGGDPGTDPGGDPGTDETNDEWKLKIKISGNIWEDGMEDQNNGLKENGELGLDKVRVNIYKVDKNNNRTGEGYYTYSDAVGNYELAEVLRGMYDIEFVYDGQHYRSTKMLVNGNIVDYKADYTHKKYINNSVTQEVENERDSFNRAYTEIAGNDTAIGVRGAIGLTYETDINTSKIQTTDNGYVKDQFAMASRTSSYNIFYPISKEIIIQDKKYIKIVDSKDVNFGLSKRYITDLSLKTDLYETIFSIKGNVQRYIFSERNIRDINSNIEKDEYIQKVNRADYNWKLDDLLSKAPNEEIKQRLLEILGNASQCELENYLDYMIIIRNSGEKDEAQIAELANYYSKDLEYATQYRDFDITSWAQVKYDTVNEDISQNKTDKIEIKWTTNSKYGNIYNPYSDEYQKIYTTGLDREELRVRKGEYLEVHIILKTKKDAEGKIELDENNKGKVSLSEINGYKTYNIADGKIAGLIDSDSKPGNANPNKQKEYYEDDEDKAPSLLLQLDESSNNGDSMDNQNESEIKRDENGNPIGYGNVIEGNVWEDDKTGENVQKLVNNQIIGDGIRQENENLIQDVTVELVEYFKHPTDANKDVYLTLKTQKTRAVLSLSHDEKLEGGYSFINLASGSYQTRYIYGDEEQLQKNLTYNGQDYQAIQTKDINEKSETNKSYQDVEIMLVLDASGSMNRNGIEKVKEVAEKLAKGLYEKLPEVKIGLTKFNQVAEVMSEPKAENDKIIKMIKNLDGKNETAIGYGLDKAINSYSEDAKKKIMIVLTDSEETVQNIEQVIKQIEIATDDNKIDLNTVLTKENHEIFGTESQPRRGIVYQIYNVNVDEMIQKICDKIFDESQIETNTSSAKDLEGDEYTPGTRAYGIAKYKLMNLDKAQSLDIKSIQELTGNEKNEAIKKLAEATYMRANSKMINFNANNVKSSYIHELNLALMKRPQTKLTMDTKIVGVKVTLQDGNVIIDTSKGVNKNVMGIDNEELPISVYMDEEIMHGAVLQVQYETTVRNRGEIDTLSNYISSDDSNSTVTTSAKLVFNYTSKNMLYREEEDNSWTITTIDAIDGKVTNNVITQIKKDNLQVYETGEFGVELYPEDSIEVQNGTGYAEAKFITTLSKLMTSENNDIDLTFDTSMEIVERQNTAGRRSENEIPGDYVPNSIPIQEDSTKSRRIIVTKPLGEQKETYYVIAVAILIVLALGIVGIKLTLQKKNDKKEIYK